MPSAAGGPSGVHSVFGIVRADVDSVLLNLGRAPVDDLTAADAFLAADFSHGLNAPTAFPACSPGRQGRFKVPGERLAGRDAWPAGAVSGQDQH